MLELRFGTVDVEVVDIDMGGRDGETVQFRMRSVAGDFFTHEIVVPRTTFVSENGYGGDREALLEDARGLVEKLVATGRFEDLEIVRGGQGWQEPTRADQKRLRHSSHYEV